MNVTEHLGNPHTLVCAKTNAEYERAIAAHRVDLEQLASLRSLRNWCASTARHKKARRPARTKT
jgi:hypothetical protein